MPNVLASLGVGAVFTPLSLNGLQFWFKADSLVLSDGTAVSSWSDSSGNGYTASQATGTLQPLYHTNRINGKPAVTWDRSNDRLTTTSVNHNIGTGDFTVIGVIRSPAANVGYSSLVTTGVGGNPGFYFDQRQVDVYWGADKRFSSVVLADNTTYLLYIQRVGSTISVYVNGSLDASSYTVATSLANGVWYLGNEDSGTVATSNFDIGELVLYSASFDSKQRAQLQVYFNERYAIF